MLALSALVTELSSCPAPSQPSQRFSCCLPLILGLLSRITLKERSGCLSLSLREQPQEFGTIPVMPMNTSANDHDPQENQPEALLHLTLAGLLPDNQKLVINSSARTAILLAQTSQGEADIVTMQQFSPNGMRVLVPVLQAYPNYCPYEALLAALFSLTIYEAPPQLPQTTKLPLPPIPTPISRLV